MASPERAQHVVIKVEQSPKNWVAKAWALPRQVLTGTIAQVQKSYKQLKNRYGPRYTKAMVGTAFIALFMPIPGSVLIAVALIVVIAEVHRAISKRGGFPKASADLVALAKANMPCWATGRWPLPPLSKSAAGTSPKDLIMSTNCDVILQWSATSEQLTVLGAALWRWCNRAAGATGVYQYLDNQALADLIAGKLPAPSQAERRGAHFRVRDEAAPDRQATIDSLRREIPAEGIEDIVVDGESWNLVESKNHRA